MVRLNRIYTKTGDDGSTALGNGQRVSKTHPRIEAYGTVDELGAVIGIAVTCCEDAATVERLQRIQNDLFDVGADLCVPPREDEKAGEALRVTEAQVERLEADIDVVNAKLPELRSFVLSGGTPAAAHLHHARCVARRAERAVLVLVEQEPGAVGQCAQLYLNRLSDLLFVLARSINGGQDVLWKPGGADGQSD